jgi:predicted dinucleotide-binding enzyme
MKIGSIGATLARKLAASGRGIKLANSNRPDTIRDLREIARARRDLVRAASAYGRGSHP